MYVLPSGGSWFVLRKVGTSGTYAGGAKIDMFPGTNNNFQEDTLLAIRLN